MEFEILDERGSVVNRIVADEVFVQTNFPGRYRRATAPVTGWGFNAAPYILSVQAELDRVARSFGYGNDAMPPMLSAATYAEEPAVEKFQREGRALRAWRSLVWERCYALFAEVQSGTRTALTLDELLVELPKPPTLEQMK